MMPVRKEILVLIIAFLFGVASIYFYTQEKAALQLTETATLSQDEIISIVRNLPEVKNFFEGSLNSRREDVKYEPKILVERYENNLWHLWVFENVRYDTGIGHATTFNRYVVDDTGKVKCSFAIFEGTKRVGIRSDKEYPCI